MPTGRPAESLGLSLGSAIMGTDIDREGARLEGLDLGSQIQSRRAQTQNALAQARIRQNTATAQEELADAIEKMGLPRELATAGLAGLGNLEQLVGGLEGQQAMGFRSTVADPTSDLETIQRNLLALSGQPIESKDVMGPGGELFVDALTPSAENVVVTPTGAAQIGLDVARGEKSLADAALAQERTLHPERFRAPAKVAAAAPDVIKHFLPTGGGTSVIPDDVSLEEAFGLEAFVTSGINNVADFLGGGTQFPQASRAHELMNELSARIQLGMLADMPGGMGRPNIRTLELLKRYAEDPRSLFRGDEGAVHNLTTTLNATRRNLEDIKLQLSSPSAKTPTLQGKLEGALIKTANLVADLERAQEIVAAGKARKEILADEATGEPDAEGWVTLPNGVRYRQRVE